MAKKKAALSPSKHSFEDALLTADAKTAADALAKVGDLDATLVEAWVAQKNVAAVVTVAEDERVPAAARKAARRGINILKARGVPVPERTHVARISDDALEGHDAWLMPPDGRGATVVMIAARWKSGRHRLLQAVLRDGIGLVEMRTSEMSRAQLKNSFDDNAKRLGFAPTPVPVDWARSRIAAARSDNAKSGAVVPLGLDMYADLLAPPPASPPPHPIDGADLGLGSRDAIIPVSGNLHGEPEFASWLPHNQALQELISDIGKQMAGGASGPEQDPAKIDGIISSAIDAATDRFFAGPEVREIVVSRMKDAAISILARRGKERAVDVLTVAEATRSAGLITSPSHEIPFLRGFFQKALALLAERTGGQLSIPVPTGEGLQGETKPSEPDVASPSPPT